ncbi:COG3650 family protein [Alteraurantiacibacter palmitatis]|uniref:COG3650 family protein n=1 Tax=Alteraurantiacibacter palmitatis TaxID=2054628 RepID=A0ABV7E4V0_9SPHN
MRQTCLPLALCLALAACSSQPDGQLPGNVQDDQPFSAIAPDEVIRLVGTEPFWGGEIAGDVLRWSTPENIDGQAISVERFAGRGGLSFSGTLDGGAIDIVVTPAPCSDGMSDRTYPFAVTVQKRAEQLNGCGWSDRQPYTGGSE